MRRGALKEINPVKSITEAFYGLYHKPKIDEGWLYDMVNMTCDDTPVLSSRKPFWMSGYEQFDCAVDIGNGKIAFVHGNLFVYDEDTPVNIGYKTNRKMVRMGTTVIIFPDCFYYNSSEDYGWFNYDHQIEEISIQPCDADGIGVDEYRSDTEPTIKRNGDYWIDTSEYQEVIKKWSSESSSWTSISADHFAIVFDGENNDFKEGDCVTLSMNDLDSYWHEYGSEEIENYIGRGGELDSIVNTPLYIVKKSTFVKSSNTIGASPLKTKIVIAGIIKRKYTVKDNLASLKNIVPELDFVIECDNRLWGCRYGEQNGKTVNEVYASKYGDYTQWSVFEGIDSDSYAVTMGSSGKFTGAIVYNGNPIFFKENCMHKFYGSYTSAFKYTTVTCEGVMSGEGNTLRQTDGAIYYRACCGFMKYDGSIPTKISDYLGDMEFGSGAIAETHDSKYFVIVHDDFENADYLLRYDARRGIWNKWRLDESKKILNMVSTSRNVIVSFYGSEYSASLFKEDGLDQFGPVSWWFETGELGFRAKASKAYLDCQKYISKLDVRMKVEMGKSVRIFIMYDSSGEWEHVHTASGGRLRSFYVPIRPKRCDHFRMKFEGEGEFSLYAISKTIEQGSER